MSTKKYLFLDRISERLTLSRKNSGLTQKIVAQKLSFAVQTIIKYEKGERSPDVNTIVGWAKLTNTNAAWILTGKGEMLEKNKKDQGTNDEAPRENLKLEDEIKTWRDKYISVMEENSALKDRIIELEKKNS